MTLTITLNLSPEAEAKLRESIAGKDAESARQVLAEAVAPTIETLLSDSEAGEFGQKSPAELSDEEFEALLDEMLDETDRMIALGAPPLSDYALSRESIYEDYPKI